MATKKSWFPYAMISVAVIVSMVMNVYPLLLAIFMSFQNFVGSSNHFVGLYNYISVLTDPTFWFVFEVTIVWTILVVSFSGLLGLGTALLLNEEYRFRGIVRSIIIIPWVAPPVVIAYIWVWIYSAGFSPISDFLERVHLISGPIYWLSDLSIKVGPLSFPLLSLVLVGVWAGFPFVAVVFLAALQSIPREVLDAADIDSASSWQKFRHITLPLIAKVGQISILLSTIWTFNQFVYPYLMTKGGPLNFTDVLSVFIYQKAFTDFNFGYATAAAVVMTTFSGIFVALYIISSYRSLFE